MDRLQYVGPVLEAGFPADAVVAAIQRLNQNVIIEDHGAYIRVLVPNVCRVTCQAIEENLGHPFHLPGDLEQIMCAFKGMIKLTSAEATWSFAPAHGESIGEP